MTTTGARGAAISPASSSFAVTMPATGALTIASADALLQRRDLRVGRRDAGARGVDFLRAGARLDPRERLGGGLRAILRAAHARRRDLLPRRRIVPLLDRSGVGAQQLLEPLEIGGRGVELRLRGSHVRLRRLDLRRRLTDVLRPRAGADQRELRLRLIAIGRRAPERQLGVRGVEPGDDVPRRHAIPFGDLHLDEPSADLAGDADFGRFDVAGGPVGAAGAARLQAPSRARTSRDGQDEIVSS